MCINRFLNTGFWYKDSHFFNYYYFFFIINFEQNPPSSYNQWYITVFVNTFSPNSTKLFRFSTMVMISVFEYQGLFHHFEYHFLRSFYALYVII